MSEKYDALSFEIVRVAVRPHQVERAKKWVMSTKHFIFSKKDGFEGMKDGRRNDADATMA